MPSKRERRRMKRMKEAQKEDTNKRTGNSSQPNDKEEKILEATEVFDSSRYNAMSDLTAGAEIAQLADNEAIIDLQKKDAIHPEEIGNNSLKASENPNTNSADAKINPMVVEERAKTIREVNQKVAAPMSANQNAHEGEDVKVIEHERYGGNSYRDIPDWMTMTMRQYGDMVNVGLELYNQSLRNTTAMMEFWWKPFQRLWSGKID